MTLSKSEYLLFLKHRAWLWLKKHDKGKLPPIDDAAQALFEAGTRLEAYAEHLFPGARRLGFNGYEQYLSLAARTQEAIGQGATTLLQARFEAGDLTCLADAVVFSSPDTVRLYEITPSTRVKPEHELGLAFQTVVLEACGYTVESLSVIHIDPAYVRQGEIVPRELLVSADVTTAVRARREPTKRHIEEARRVAASPVCPDPSPRHCRLGSLQGWLPIYRQLVELPEGSLYDLSYPTAQQLAELEGLGVASLDGIPASFPLTGRQTRQLEALGTRQRRIDRPAIRKFLDGLAYPLHFLDYETCMSGVPPYDGTRPYQQVPCQYSLHVLDSPGGEARHTEYLHRDAGRPVEPLAAALRRDIGESGSVVVWYARFETGRNAEMAELLPEYAGFLTGLNRRAVDLMLPFSEGWYADPAFLGSASIKKVLPVLAPELSYGGLAVREGQTAQRLWMRAVLESKGTKAEAEKLFGDLLAYCELDTLAMLRIYERLVEAAAPESPAGT